MLPSPLTPAIIAADVMRDGINAVLQLLDQPDSLRRGPWPEGVDRLLPGSAAYDDRRTAALRAAWALPDQDQARIEAAKVRDLYGADPSSCSRTLAVRPDHR